MLNKSNYKPAALAAANESLRGFMELNAEAVSALTTIHSIMEGRKTPLDNQVFEELAHLYAQAHRMLCGELAKVEHAQAMQKAYEQAQKNFAALEEKHQKSNQTISVTA